LQWCGQLVFPDRPELRRFPPLVSWFLSSDQPSQLLWRSTENLARVIDHVAFAFCSALYTFLYTAGQEMGPDGGIWVRGDGEGREESPLGAKWFRVSP
jgi:hypothetical protein